MNSSMLDTIAPHTAESFAKLTDAERRLWYSNRFSFSPLQVNWRTRNRVRSVLEFADTEHRRIRRESGVRPAAGTFVVYIHRWSQAENPYPGLLRPVSVGRLYDVYELVPAPAGQ
jgi:hypothetical protein